MSSSHRRIAEGQATIALGSRYHPEHFKCQTCAVQLPAEQFFTSKGYFYCKVRPRSLPLDMHHSPLPPLTSLTTRPRLTRPTRRRT